MGRNRTIPPSASLTAPFTQGGLIIGITGGSGSGKTTLLNLIRVRGGLVLDCDEIYHDLLKTDESLLRAIENRFPGVVDETGLDRKKLGSIVFSDETHYCFIVWCLFIFRCEIKLHLFLLGWSFFS